MSHKILMCYFLGECRLHTALQQSCFCEVLDWMLFFPWGIVHWKQIGVSYSSVCIRSVLYMTTWLIGFFFWVVGNSANLLSSKIIQIKRLWCCIFAILPCCCSLVCIVVSSSHQWPLTLFTVWMFAISQPLLYCQDSWLTLHSLKQNYNCTGCAFGFAN